MNEQILKLGVEAGLYVDLDGTPWPRAMSAEESELAYAKFAELIIKECADILMKPEHVMNHPEELTDYNRGWVNGRLLGVEHIKEHFGVEE
jgi:hypothetical protein